ncbi:MAG: hypothetical protein IIA85_01615 [Nanoarchaeota archaeon]|nr:hypothetical protein [Nanoarchaeota archaeon]
MINHLPTWAVIRYSKLWRKFKEKEFTKSDADKILNNEKSVSMLLTELRKNGWLEAKTEKGSLRNVKYKLKDPSKTFLQELKDLSKK